MRRYAAILAVALAPAALLSQSPLDKQAPHSAPGKAAAVSYLYPEQVTVTAGKPSTVELHFKVAAGLHINSHTPSAEELIPTTLKFPETSGVRLAEANFPPGQDFILDSGLADQEKLSVYTGEFTVHAALVAAQGEHLVEATLRYQACDNHACTPPHNIPVVFDVIAR
jgi:hypothetical protein